MRDPKEIQEPLKTMRNSQTKLLRQATPEEIVKAALGGKIDKNTSSRAGAGGSRKKRAKKTKKQPFKTTFHKGCAKQFTKSRNKYIKKLRQTTFGKGCAKSM